VLSAVYECPAEGNQDMRIDVGSDQLLMGSDVGCA